MATSPTNNKGHPLPIYYYFGYGNHRCRDVINMYVGALPAGTKQEWLRQADLSTNQFYRCLTLE